MIDQQSQAAPADGPASLSGTTEFTTKLSPRSVADTVGRLESLVDGKGMKVFAVIDHSGEANRVGLELREAHLHSAKPQHAGPTVSLRTRSSSRADAATLRSLSVPSSSLQVTVRRLSQRYRAYAARLEARTMASSVAMAPAASTWRSRWP